MKTIKETESENKKYLEECSVKARKLFQEQGFITEDQLIKILFGEDPNKKNQDITWRDFV